MSTWLIVVLIFAAVLSPIAWIVPSRRQRYQMHLRKIALHAGIRVRIETFELLGTKNSAIAYRVMREADDKGPVHRFRLGHCARLDKEEIQYRGDEFVSGWVWLEAPSPALDDGQEASLKTLLKVLPEDTLIFEAGTAALTLWWRENGTPEQVEALAVQLAELNV
ncbi:hypothetical protein [Oceanospirillum linum]|uniref:Preprotein translocase subunit YajC n=1 Tax=Oceanospirillum linum TaxID=966 RepID=A0A1T1HDH8_OCELI|nr:hypothetical protein [Oceanospirillum linum]OOV87911.1 hypothetical protein BTA35_0207950 [Oceanospirillum linum]SEG50945.1 hypothetical protein SAMN04489856_11422 [Oleiphilus messinensis]SMP35194.1 hypothetical protein SAMN06264348_11215 [Oceanospirillum linum]